MSNSDHNTDDDDLDAFRAAMRDVTPLKPVDRVQESRARPEPRPRFREADNADVLAESLAVTPEMMEVESGDELAYLRPGVQHALLRKLRRGEVPARAELDLHGLTADAATKALREFLDEASARDLRCVRIIHGKGLRSGNRGPVLKQKTASVLRKRGDVLAFATPRAVDGGTGAVFVLLKRR